LIIYSGKMSPKSIKQYLNEKFMHKCETRLSYEKAIASLQDDMDKKLHTKRKGDLVGFITFSILCD
jgi:hypothetical protein